MPEDVMRPIDFFTAALIGGLPLVSGCQSSPIQSVVPTNLLPATTTEQKIDALRRYRACLITKAQSVDDHRSDGLTIATSMRGSCKPEIADMAKSLAGGATADAYYQIAASADRREVDAALNAVLTERTERRPSRSSSSGTR
jgi:hypothetical protein